MSSPGSPCVPPPAARERWVCRLRASLVGHGGEALGTLIAFPGRSPAVFPRLLQFSADPSSGSWSQFLKRICPEWTADSWSSELLGTLTAEEDEHQWRNLVSALEELTADTASAGLPLPEPLEAWAERVVPVGGPSFETGRSVITLAGQEWP